MPRVIAVLIVACGLSQPLDARAAPQAQAQTQTRTDQRFSDAYYQFMLGRQLEASGNVEEAIGAFKQAAVADPSSAEIPAELAALFARQNRVAEAKASAEAALTIDQANVEAHRVLGMVHASLAHLDDPAFASDPDSARNAADAIAHLDAAARVPGRQPEPGLQLLLGRLYAATRQFSKAIPVLEDLLQQEPGVPDAVALLAGSYQGAGRPGDAVALMAEAAAAEPRFSLRLAELHEQLGQWKDAAGAYERAVEQFPKDSELRTRWAMALLRMPGDAGVAKALDVLADAQRRFPDDLMLVFQQGAAFEQTKRFDEAEQAFRRVIARDPLHALALNYLGYMMADRGVRLDEAIGFIKRALAVDPQNAAYMDSLGWAYFRQNRLDLAETNLRAAADQRPRDSAIQDHYGDLLEKLGRHADAVRAWERALAGDGEQIDRPAIQRKIKTATEKIRPR